MLRIYLNGKFTAQRTTGVQRVAANLIRALDANPSIDVGRCVLLCPPGGVAPELHRIEVRHVGALGLPLHFWEQVILPLVAIKGLLINLAGAAPYFARRQACLIHDAAVFDHPEAYRRAFGVWYRLLFRRLARSAATLITVSRFSRERLALHLGIDPERIAVVPNGCDHLDGVEADDGVLHRHGLVNSRYLLAVGSTNPTKNIDAMVAAYAQLPFDAARCLVIAGGRNDRVFAGTSAIDPPGVERIGVVNDAELKSLYQHAVGLIFPSIYEGFGLPPLEAMACGCPVAAARVAAIPEVCREAVLYFDPADLAAIGEAMRQLCVDESLRDRLRKAGWQLARSGHWTASGAALWEKLRPVSAPRAAAT